MNKATNCFKFLLLKRFDSRFKIWNIKWVPYACHFMKEAQRRMIVRALTRGEAPAVIASSLGVGKSTVYRMRDKMKYHNDEGVEDIIRRKPHERHRPLSALWSNLLLRVPAPILVLSHVTQRFLVARCSGWSMKILEWNRTEWIKDSFSLLRKKSENFSAATILNRLKGRTQGTQSFSLRRSAGGRLKKFTIDRIADICHRPVIQQPRLKCIALSQRSSALVGWCSFALLRSMVWFPHQFGWTKVWKSTLNVTSKFWKTTFYHGCELISILESLRCNKTMLLVTQPGRHSNFCVRSSETTSGHRPCCGLLLHPTAINPLDYYVWNEVARTACPNSHTNINELKKDVEAAWRGQDPENIRHACKSFRRRIQVVYDADGDCVEWRFFYCNECIVIHMLPNFCLS